MSEIPDGNVRVNSNQSVNRQLLVRLFVQLIARDMLIINTKNKSPLPSDSLGVPVRKSDRSSALRTVLYRTSRRRVIRCK